jgi:hypothetical protein
MSKYTLPIRIHSVLLNQVSTGTTLPLTVVKKLVKTAFTNLHSIVGLEQPAVLQPGLREERANGLHYRGNLQSTANKLSTGIKLVRCEICNARFLNFE